MRTIGRSITGFALALLALGVSGDAVLGQEIEDSSQSGALVREIDATRGLAINEDQTMRIQIRNDLAPAGSVIVSVVSLTRPELVLGAVHANEAKEYLIDTRLYAGGFQLIATGSMAGTQVSRKIDVANQVRVKWSLGTGLVRVERLSDAEADTR